MLKCVIVLAVSSTISAFVFDNDTNTLNSTIVKSERNFVSACGDVFSKKQFVLESINYPSSYPPNSDCSYLIKGPYCPTYFQFQFLDFQLENSVGCTKDRLEVENLDALCGSRSGIKNYFSETGALQVHFKSDGEGSGRGFKISVTRLPCNVKPDQQNEETPPVSGTTEPALPNNLTNRGNFNPGGYLPPDNQRACCNNIYKSKASIVVSPNFPYSLNSPSDCHFKIERYSEQVCRLRIDVSFFNLGMQVYNTCPEGYIQIDGKVICGCKQNLKLISQFNEGETFKTIRFKTPGWGRQFNTGFVLHITQDECPKRYTPAPQKLRNQSAHFANDQKNTVAWPQDDHKTFKNRLNFINERTEILDDHPNKVNTVETNDVIKHFYYFVHPDEVKHKYRDVEESSYIYTVNIDYILPDDNNFNYCWTWNYYQINNLLSIYGDGALKCQKSDQNNEATNNENCVDLSYVRGYFKSPGYPSYYPPSTRVCYRFRKEPGYCAIRIYMNDFQLEPSANCHKSYMTWSNAYKYCGNSLHNVISTVEFNDRPEIVARFVSNGENYYCGRGFFGVYEQLACQDTNFPITPAPPPYPTTTPPPVQPTVPCDRTYEGRNFLIDVHDSNVCVYTIKKSNWDTCVVNLMLEIFDLPCRSGSVTIGGVVYCGRLSGRTVTLNLTNGPQQIVYRGYNSGSILVRIRGEQLQNSCEVPEVEPARLKKTNTDTTNDTSIAFALKNKQFKEICGIISKSEESLCTNLVENNNATKCMKLSEDALKEITLTYSKEPMKKIELTLKGDKKPEEIEYQEIDCDKI